MPELSEWSSRIRYGQTGLRVFGVERRRLSFTLAYPRWWRTDPMRWTDEELETLPAAARVETATGSYGVDRVDLAARRVWVQTRRPWGRSFPLDIIENWSRT